MTERTADDLRRLVAAFPAAHVRRNPALREQIAAMLEREHAAGVREGLQEGRFAAAELIECECRPAGSRSYCGKCSACALRDQLRGVRRQMRHGRWGIVEGPPDPRPWERHILARPVDSAPC